MAGRRELPGFYYDEEKLRYFRAPPRHVAYMTAHERQPKTAVRPSAEPHSTSSSVISQVDRLTNAGGFSRDHMPKSMYGLQAHIATCLDPVLFRQTLSQTLLCSSSPVQVTACGEVGLPNGYVYDIKLNEGGTLAAVSTKYEVGALRASQVTLSPSRRNEVKLVPYPALYKVGVTGGSCVSVSSCGSDTEIVSLLDANGKFTLAQIYQKVLGLAEGELSWVLKDTAISCINKTSLPNLLCSVQRYTGGVLSAVPGNYNESGSARHTGRISVLGFPQQKLTPLSVHRVGHESPLMSLTFREEPLHLYAGTRSGTVVSFDLRTNSKSSAIFVPKDSKIAPSIIGLHAVGHDYLITSCMDSKLLLWDCRMNRKVLDYAGHCNSHYWCKSVVDKSESFVACVGQDKSIRVWSVYTGTLLRCISMTEYVDDASVMDGEFPAIAHTDRLGGIDGVHALLIGTPKGITAFASL